MVVMIDSSNDGVNYRLSAIFDKSAQLSSDEGNRILSGHISNVKKESSDVSTLPS